MNTARPYLIELMILLFTVTPMVTYADGAIDMWSRSKKPGVSPVQLQQYSEVCGSCHFPYQPGLLPARSWEVIMSSLDAHFGKTLELSPVEARTMRRYVLDNSAGHVNDEISHKMLHSLSSETIVTRITETPYFVTTHNKIERTGEKGTMWQCDRCHQEAIQGKYQPHQ